MSINPKIGGRRREYAEATKQAILEAARELFTDHGYFATTVDEIAERARVAPATVYAVAGGKHGLLRKLIEALTSSPIVAATIAEIVEIDDAKEIIRIIAENSRRMREEFGDIVRVMLVTAPHDDEVAKTVAAATAEYRRALVPIAQQLANLGALREGLEVDYAIDVLWFYFGYWGLFTLHDENGWSYERAEHWLRDAASQALLRF